MKFVRFLTFSAIALSVCLFAAQWSGEIRAWSADAQPAIKTQGDDLYRKGFYAEAAQWWEAEAAKGSADAAYHLGVIYMDGIGKIVPRDEAKALKFHMQAALAGEARSMMDLGTIHEYGYGVPQDLKEAAKWYRRSADYGHGPAQYNLATMLETGDAVDKDLVEALKYYLLAAERGIGGVPYDRTTNRVIRGGEGPLELLLKQLSDAQVADAKKRAADFKPLTGPLKL